MLTFATGKFKHCDGHSRRSFIKAGAMGIGGFTFADLLRAESEAGIGSSNKAVINIHLDGKNPDLYGGHPIVFNLNINGSLPEFFEALFMTGSFEESILNQIRADY